MLIYSLLATLQIVDIALHFSADQIEPLRILASFALVLAVTLAEQRGPQTGRLLLGSGIAYLFLNLVFLAQNGLINPETDALRIPLFVVVSVSLALLWLYSRQLKHLPD